MFCQSLIYFAIISFKMHIRKQRMPRWKQKQRFFSLDSAGKFKRLRINHEKLANGASGARIAVVITRDLAPSEARKGMETKRGWGEDIRRLLW